MTEHDTTGLGKIVDGDTLDTSTGRARLVGEATPERGQLCATEATERLRELADDVLLFQRIKEWILRQGC